MKPFPENAIVLGLTGAFGSGCTTVGNLLADHRRFTAITISSIIRRSLERQLAGKPGGLESAPPIGRKELQDHGDTMRRQDPSYWVKEVVDLYEAESTPETPLTIDGIRNPAEVEWLRKRFRHFFLVAVDAPPDIRWARCAKMSDEYKDRSYFDALSARDMEAPEEWGQRVQQCVDQADYVITNDTDVAGSRRESHLLSAADDLLSLADPGRLGRRPTDAESFMHQAYASAARSACLKRSVGALVVNPGAERQLGVRKAMHQAPIVLGVGHNDNPDWMAPCYEAFGGCHLDDWKREQLNAPGRKFCPSCGAGINTESWPYRCSDDKCASETSLLDAFFPDRGMSHCTAIHAEERAILNSRGAELTGAHLYTTTFPCFSCARHIIQAGIVAVVYVEPYPDGGAADLLARHGIEMIRFSGVKSLGFSRLFSQWRAKMDRKLNLAS